MTSRTEQLFDKRIVARNIKRNKISQAEHQNYLASLPDVSDKAVPIFYDTEARDSRHKADGE